MTIPQWATNKDSDGWWAWVFDHTFRCTSLTGPFKRPKQAEQVARAKFATQEAAAV